MDKEWKKYLPPACAALGLALELGAAWVCLGLDQGAAADGVRAAGVLALLSLGALALLRLEGYGRDALSVMLLPVGAAMLARAVCLDYVSLDYTQFLSEWYDYFKANGGFAAIAGSVGDYNAPYLYFMAAISYLDTPGLYLIKLFSILWDVVLAWGCLRLARSLTRERQGSAAPLMAFGAALLLPTAVLNGAYWGQCDAIYGALCVHAAASALDGRNKASAALMGVAFAFKLQSIFVLPLWGVLWLAGKVKFRELWVFPLTYLISIVPALLLGKPLGDILGIYFNQMGEYSSRLVLNAPTVYQLLPYGTEDPGHLALLGVLAAGTLSLALLAAGFLFRGRMDNGLAMAAAVVLCVGVPFLLPYMHERYFFLADVFTLCWACANWKRLPAAVLVEASSLASYILYLRLKFNYTVTLGGRFYVMPLETAAMLAALAFSLAMLVRELRNHRKGLKPA